MRDVPALPPGYHYSRYRSRVQIRYPKTEHVNQTLPGYWRTDENAAKAAWNHYNTSLETATTSDFIPPLDDKEQAALIALFQAFLSLPHAKDLRLHFYADTAGGLTDLSGATKADEKQIAQWMDMAEGLETIRAMKESEQSL